MIIQQQFPFIVKHLHCKMYLKLSVFTALLYISLYDGEKILLQIYFLTVTAYNSSREFLSDALFVD